MKEGGHQGEVTFNVRFDCVEKNGDWLAATKIAGVGGENADERQGEEDIVTEDVAS